MGEAAEGAAGEGLPGYGEGEGGPGDRGGGAVWGREETGGSGGRGGDGSSDNEVGTGDFGIVDDGWAGVGTASTLAEDSGEFGEEGGEVERGKGSVCVENEVAGRLEERVSVGAWGVVRRKWGRRRGRRV